MVGGVDSLCLTTLYGFNSLQLVSSQPCKPFDAARNGIAIDPWFYGVPSWMAADPSTLPTVIEVTYSDNTTTPWRDATTPPVTRAGVDAGTTPYRKSIVAMQWITRATQAARRLKSQLSVEPDRIHGRYFAIGTGADPALAMMMIGKTPKEAVRIACRIDVANSGGSIKVLHLTPMKKVKVRKKPMPIHGPQTDQPKRVHDASPTPEF